MSDSPPDPPPDTPHDHEPDLPAFSAMISRALGDLLAPGADGFAAMMAEDGVMEFPFAPPGLPARLEGRDAIAAHLAGLPALLSIESLSEPEVHLGRDGETAVLEFDCRGRAVATGRPYEQRYVSVITVRDGRIARYRDYWNPLVVLDSLGDGAIPSRAPGDGARTDTLATTSHDGGSSHAGVPPGNR